MATNGAQYDSALLGILQNEGKVAPFLDVILGFLYRRTDFFRIMKTETDRLGFPPGVALKLLNNIFSKYESLALKDNEKRDKMVQAKTKATAEKKASPSSSSTNSQKESCNAENPSKNETKSKQSLEQQPASLIDTNEKQTENVTSDAVVKDNTENDTEEKEDPELIRQRRELQSNPLTYNGAETETYFWSQNITEVDVRVKVPSHIKKGKQVKAEVKPKHVQVSFQDSDGRWNAVVDNELTWPVNKEESMWTLVPGEFVHLNLEKRQERWWEAVFTDESKINTRKIDCSRPMSDLDDEAQAKIEEMMYNQRQKQLGLPQSHELKTHEMLRKAWDAEGSPFKGQPFDPSKFSVDPNGIVNMNQ